ncbi:MAG: hypothetical protein HOM51_00905 [Rhodospirillaceae bacterium]|nr:hypothetical protein [Rhodospirillaceae bacterium]
MSEKLTLFIQFCIATGIGCWVYWMLVGGGATNPKELVFGPLLFGGLGLWIVMRIWAWIRYGWNSKISMDH